MEKLEQDAQNKGQIAAVDGVTRLYQRSLKVRPAVVCQKHEVFHTSLAKNGNHNMN